MRVLAIDAGTVKAGFAVMEGDKVITSEEIKLVKGDLGERLVDLAGEVTNWIDLYDPEVVLLEDGFAGGYATATKATAMARAMVLLKAAEYQRKLVMYLPAFIKQTVAGKGNATKDEVRAAVKSYTGIDCSAKQEDMADAIAIGLTHYLRSQEAI